MQGKCTLKQCPCGDDNDVAVAACTSCKKPVHHMCFTITYEGDLNVCVCSDACSTALGLKQQVLR
ncbi:hypothetical protein L917_02629 [Phytophthora nicotianae]|uniref:Zinc finger PHD-type domain-containing protein n=2 Tax=Phytophthora nicotianae TaxID=4792 RepID=W2RDR0_PHYN3|nr:hypothetical protein PPTG_20659 [Phytophthora nicotianae INRA-310]ETM00669.1 hypothetical protein L917_02629 [Phytophthora nicotianae]ETN23532.1 hypothetical protein PPTG_20659 [Phytophthora nicotianae INRA-310]